MTTIDQLMVNYQVIEFIDFENSNRCLNINTLSNYCRDLNNNCLNLRIFQIIAGIRHPISVKIFWIILLANLIDTSAKISSISNIFIKIEIKPVKVLTLIIINSKM
jgi:hypothetical protein